MLCVLCMVFVCVCMRTFLLCISFQLQTTCETLDDGRGSRFLQDEGIGPVTARYHVQCHTHANQFMTMCVRGV